MLDQHRRSSVDGMLQLQAARALEYADHLGGSTGLLVKDYRGEKMILKFDAALMAQINATLRGQESLARIT